LHSVSSTVENGFVYIPTQAEWLSQYLHEMAVFPNGKFDDQVDSTSQALDWSKSGVGADCLGVIGYERRLAAKLGLRSQLDSPQNQMIQYHLKYNRASILRDRNPRW
jgi:hypothetical protein